MWQHIIYNMCAILSYNSAAYSVWLLDSNLTSFQSCQVIIQKLQYVNNIIQIDEFTAQSILPYLDIEAPVAARPFTEHRSSLPTVLFTNIPVELNAKPVFNFIKRRINNSNGQRTVGLKKKKAIKQKSYEVPIKMQLNIIVK